jgi:hypothetical protein
MSQGLSNLLLFNAYRMMRNWIGNLLVQRATENPILSPWETSHLTKWKTILDITVYGGFFVNGNI